MFGRMAAGTKPESVELEDLRALVNARFEAITSKSHLGTYLTETWGQKLTLLAEAPSHCRAMSIMRGTHASTAFV